MNMTMQERFEAALASLAALTPDQLVKRYVQTREKKSARAKVWAEEEAQYNRIMERIENLLLKVADEQKVQGFKTVYGTTYTDKTMKLSIADDVAWEAWLRKQEHPFVFFERRVAVQQVKNYMAANDNALPPGLNKFEERVMRVRKGD